MSDLDNLFEGMEDAEASGGADFFIDGVYTVKTKSFEYRDGYQGKSFIARFQVDESSNPSVPPGSTRSWILKLDGKPDKKKRNIADIKNLFFALQGIEPSSVVSYEKNKKDHEEAFALFRAAIDPDFAAANKLDPFDCIGLPVKLEAKQKEYTDKQGRPGVFTNHYWSPATA